MIVSKVTFYKFAVHNYSLIVHSFFCDARLGAPDGRPTPGTGTTAGAGEASRALVGGFHVRL